MEHVDELVAGQSLRDVGDLFLAGRRLDEDHVGTGCEVGGGAVQRRRIASTAIASVRPMTRIGIVQGVAHRVQPLHHLGVGTSALSS